MQAVGQIREEEEEDEGQASSQGRPTRSRPLTNARMGPPKSRSSSAASTSAAGAGRVSDSGRQMKPARDYGAKFSEMWGPGTQVGLIV